MNGHTETRNYKVPFLVTLAICIALFAGLALMWWHAGRVSQRSSTETQGQARAATDASHASDAFAPTSPAQEPAALAPVQLTPQRMQSIGVKLGTVEYRNVSDEIRATGNVDMDETRLAYIQTRFPGWVRKVYADATYRYIRKGEALFTIYSPDLVTTEQEYLLARQNQQKLENSAVGGVSAGAASLVDAARQRLAQWEVPESEISKLEATGKAITELTFNSPVSGYITEKNVLPNMYVQPETKLYTVADLSSVWVYAQVFQNDLGKVRPGEQAQITVDAYPGAIFSGRVEQILPQVDMTTRTARVRLVLANPGLKLKPGMYVNVALKTPLGRALVVPVAAVFQSGTRQIVFVNQGEGRLEPREIQTDGRVGDQVIIAKGLKANESIVTSANFLIDSESQLQAATGAFVPPPPGAGGAAAMNNQGAAESAQANIELSTEPAPPHKGNNIFRVKLTNKDGSPITGAQVAVIFYMAAMPAMGMAAMKTSVNCTETASGIYEGRGELDSGGSWQVTMQAQKNGQTLALKQFTVNAEGGM
jgi:Cu(I)/Ag(I) efflux system membrane fusion protein/cobalt-zinc-cadmium efflux system membrane fusion protein